MECGLEREDMWADSPRRHEGQGYRGIMYLQKFFLWTYPDIHKNFSTYLDHLSLSLSYVTKILNSCEVRMINIVSFRALVFICNIWEKKTVSKIPNPLLFGARQAGVTGWKQLFCCWHWYTAEASCLRTRDMVYDYGLIRTTGFTLCLPKSLRGHEEKNNKDLWIGGTGFRENLSAV